MFTEKEQIKEKLMRDIVKLEFELSKSRIEVQRGAAAVLFDVLVEMVRLDQFNSTRNILGRLAKVVHARRADAH